MGRTGLWSSAAAGVSLIAAALILVAGVSTLIAFRGFRGVQDTRQPTQSVVIAAPSDRERGAPAPTPESVVIGGEPRRGAKRARARGIRIRAARARRTSRARRRATVEAPSRSGLAAPAKPAPAAAPAAPEPEPRPAPAAPNQAPPASSPLDKVVEDVAETIPDTPVGEKVGDVLLDLRDVLP